MKLFCDETYSIDCKNKIDYFNIGTSIVDNYAKYIEDDILYGYIKISEYQISEYHYKQIEYAPSSQQTVDVS